MFWLTDLILSSEGRKLHTAGQAGPTALVQVVQTWLHASAARPQTSHLPGAGTPEGPSSGNHEAEEVGRESREAGWQPPPHRSLAADWCRGQGVSFT